jgi:hypothetical protein
MANASCPSLIHVAVTRFAAFPDNSADAAASGFSPASLAPAGSTPSSNRIFAPMLGATLREIS